MLRAGVRKILMNHLVHICYSDYPLEQNTKEGEYSLSLSVL